MQGDIWAGFHELDVVKNEENETVQWAPNFACCGTECRHMCSATANAYAVRASAQLHPALPPDRAVPP
jgi:hypothetical protein